MASIRGFTGQKLEVKRLTSVATKLHHEGSVGRGGNTTSGKVNGRQTLQSGGLLEEMEGGTELRFPKRNT